MQPLPEANHPSAPPPTWSITLDKIDPNPFQPRREMDEAALAELVASIGEHGLLQPITVRRIGGGRYQVIGGHRRLEAYRRLCTAAPKEAKERFASIPAHEKFDVSDEEMALFALVENMQRDDLSPLDAALGLLRYQEAQSLSTEVLSKRTGLELDRVKRLLRLSRAPKVVQDACHEGVVVDLLDERGEAKLAASGSPKRERLRLDLLAALEFAKLHAQVAKSAPKKADERTSRAIERALSERWGVRRVQAFIKTALSSDDAEAAEVPAKAEARRVPLFVDGPELRIRRAQVQGASPAERKALLELLKPLVQELAS
jgi:ParB/RepB/Spo0J family partition protein